jgi:hypothetical protein
MFTYYVLHIWYVDIAYTKDSPLDSHTFVLFRAYGCFAAQFIASRDSISCWPCDSWKFDQGGRPIAVLQAHVQRWHDVSPNVLWTVHTSSVLNEKIVPKVCSCENFILVYEVNSHTVAIVLAWWVIHAVSLAKTMSRLRLATVVWLYFATYQCRWMPLIHTWVFLRVSFCP